MKAALIYGTCTGNTQDAAELILDEWGDDAPTLIEVSETSLEDLAEYDLLIIGCSTWDVGELQYDWNDIYDQLPEGNVKFENTQIAFFGLGDQAGYPDTYQDAIGMLHERFQGAGAKVGIGYTDPSDHEFDDSRALIDGKFCGLALDQDAQPNLTQPRIIAWVAQLKTELNQPVPA